MNTHSQERPPSPFLHIPQLPLEIIATIITYASSTLQDYIKLSSLSSIIRKLTLESAAPTLQFLIRCHPDVKDLLKAIGNNSRSLPNSTQLIQLALDLNIINHDTVPDAIETFNYSNNSQNLEATKLLIERGSYKINRCHFGLPFHEGDERKPDVPLLKLLLDSSSDWDKENERCLYLLNGEIFDDDERIDDDEAVEADAEADLVAGTVEQDNNITSIESNHDINEDDGNNNVNHNENYSHTTDYSESGNTPLFTALLYRQHTSDDRFNLKTIIILDSRHSHSFYVAMTYLPDTELEYLEMLMERGGLNYRTYPRFFHVAMFHACMGGSRKKLDMLIGHRDREVQRAEASSPHSQDTELMYGASLRDRNRMCLTKKQERTEWLKALKHCFMYAAYYDHLEIFKYLETRFHLDPFEPYENWCSESPLHVSIAGKHKMAHTCLVFRYLIDRIQSLLKSPSDSDNALAKAVLNHKTYEGTTPIEYAAIFKPGMIYMLLETGGVDVTAPELNSARDYRMPILGRICAALESFNTQKKCGRTDEFEVERVCRAFMETVLKPEWFHKNGGGVLDMGEGASEVSIVTQFILSQLIKHGWKPIPYEHNEEDVDYNDEPPPTPAFSVLGRADIRSAALLHHHFPDIIHPETELHIAAIPSRDRTNENEWSPNALCEVQETLLHTFCRTHVIPSFWGPPTVSQVDVESLRYLLLTRPEVFADLNCLNSFGETPLHVLVSCEGSVGEYYIGKAREGVLLFADEKVRGKVDWNVRDGLGRTVLDVATHSQDVVRACGGGYSLAVGKNAGDG
jgi:hypothetical protein